MPSYGALFDMDGVLVDSYQPHLKAWQMFSARQGKQLTQDEFASTFGRTGPDIIRMFWPHATKEQTARWDLEKEEAYRQIISQDFPAMPGASALLSSLHKVGFALAIGSSGPALNVEAVVKGLPGGDLFCATVSMADVSRGKPDPEVFLKAAAKLGLPPQRCVVVEDAPVGVQAARAAGCCVVALLGTASAQQLSEADRIVESLAELSPADFTQLIDSRAAAGCGPKMN